jgi:arginine deiminase
LKGVLQKTATTYEVSDLLKDVLKSDKVRFDIINRVCTNENAIDIRDYLLGLSSDELGRQLIEGVVMQKDSLTKFLSKDKYSLQPLHNFFFTRDSLYCCARQGFNRPNGKQGQDARKPHNGDHI